MDGQTAGALAGDDEALDLRPELGIVREVMRRLLRLWDAQGDAITPEEARRLAALLFNGARTVAVLLYRQPDKPDDDFAAWLDAAVETLGREMGVSL